MFLSSNFRQPRNTRWILPHTPATIDTPTADHPKGKVDLPSIQETQQVEQRKYRYQAHVHLAKDDSSIDAREVGIGTIPLPFVLHRSRIGYHTRLLMLGVDPILVWLLPVGEGGVCHAFLVFGGLVRRDWVKGSRNTE